VRVHAVLGGTSIRVINTAFVYYLTWHGEKNRGTELKPRVAIYKEGEDMPHADFHQNPHRDSGSCDHAQRQRRQRRRQQSCVELGREREEIGQALLVCVVAALWLRLHALCFFLILKLLVGVTWP
jgi:hypothetical protein